MVFHVSKFSTPYLGWIPLWGVTEWNAGWWLASWRLFRGVLQKSIPRKMQKLDWLVCTNETREASLCWYQVRGLLIRYGRQKKIDIDRDVGIGIGAPLILLPLYTDFIAENYMEWIQPLLDEKPDQSPSIIDFSQNLKRLSDMYEQPSIAERDANDTSNFYMILDNTVESRKQMLDTADMLERRNFSLIGENAPEWWTDASEEEKNPYQSVLTSYISSPIIAQNLWDPVLTELNKSCFLWLYLVWGSPIGSSQNFCHGSYENFLVIITQLRQAKEWPWSFFGSHVKILNISEEWDVLWWLFGCWYSICA